MSTKPLQPGMCNFPVNMTKEERTILQEQAAKEDRSVGSFIKSMYLEGLKLHHPEMAEKIVQIRLSRRMIQGGLMLIVGLFSIAVSTFDDDDQLRASRVVRVSRVGRRLEFES